MIHFLTFNLYSSAMYSTLWTQVSTGIYISPRKILRPQKKFPSIKEVKLPSPQKEVKGSILTKAGEEEEEEKRRDGSPKVSDFQGQKHLLL